MSAPASTTVEEAEQSSITSRPLTVASAPCASSSPAVRSIVIPTSGSWCPRAAPRGDRSSLIAWTRHIANTVPPSVRSSPSSRAATSTSRCTHRSNKIVQRSQQRLRGSDYPHYEGTFGHTQKVLHELFDDVSPDLRQRITVGAFEELFPHVPPAPEGEPREPTP